MNKLLDGNIDRHLPTGIRSSTRSTKVISVHPILDCQMDSQIDTYLQE